MVLVSSIQQGAVVPFAKYSAERVYMRKFFQSERLPTDLRRWQDTVDAMLEGVTTDKPIFLMVDQAYVRAGATQRRPGLHVDNYWHEALWAHGGGHIGGGHGGRPIRGPGHGGPLPGHGPRPLSPGHRDVPGPGHGPGPGHSSSGSSELLILASNVLGCRALLGTTDQAPGDGGACEHFDTSGLLSVDLAPGLAWRGDTGSMLHEALPLASDALRTVVRLNVRL